MEEMIKVIALVGQYEDGGDLWLDPKDPNCGQFIYDHIENNIEDDEPLIIKIDEVSKADFERED